MPKNVGTLSSIKEKRKSNPYPAIVKLNSKILQIHFSIVNLQDFFIFQKYITSLFEVCHHRNVHSPYENKPISGNLIFLITYKKQCIIALLIVWN